MIHVWEKQTKTPIPHNGALTRHAQSFHPIALKPVLCLNTSSVYEKNKTKRFVKIGAFQKVDLETTFGAFRVLRANLR